jgi:5-methylcytosine-specific restriction endonuclease McrA
MTKEEKKAAYNKAWRLANKEKKAAYTKAYRLANKEKKAAYTKAWQQANPEKRVAYNNAYFLRLNLMNKKISRRTLAAWSVQVRERDTACLYCGSTSNLHAHHILSKVKHPDWALFLNNGITLCEPCHIIEHTLNGDV